MIKLILISLLPVFLILSSCSTKQKFDSTIVSDRAQWETKAQIHDLTNDKTHNINLDVFAIKNDKMRIEATAFAGYQVASFLLTREKVSCAVYTQKRFYTGKPSEEALRPLINLQIHPAILSQIAFDQAPSGSGWSCQKGADGFIASCLQTQQGIEIKWTERKEGTKKVTLKGPRFEMVWFFKAPTTEVQFKPALFELQTPPSFRIIQLN